MTLTEMMSLANMIRSSSIPKTSPVGEFVNSFLDLFEESAPCMMEPYTISDDGRLVIGDTNSLEEGGELSPADARAYAKALLLGADEAEV